MRVCVKISFEACRVVPGMNWNDMYFKFSSWSLAQGIHRRWSYRKTSTSMVAYPRRMDCYMSPMGGGFIEEVTSTSGRVDLHVSKQLGHTKVEKRVCRS
jgi:hypothetical protein